MTAVIEVTVEREPDGMFAVRGFICGRERRLTYAPTLAHAASEETRMRRELLVLQVDEAEFDGVVSTERSLWEGSL